RAGKARAEAGSRSAAPSPSCRRTSSLTSVVPLALLETGFGSGVRTAANDVADLLAAARRDHARALLVLQRVEGGAHHVVRVRRAERLRNHVLDAERLEHGAHRTAGDDAG